MKELRKFSSDMTYGQSISPFGPNDHRYFSFDLTTATDRIPIRVYLCILNHFFGEHITEAWKTIMVGFPFTYQGKEYTYNTGQPMGFYSSWALLAYAHHALVRYCALKCGLHHFKDYRILGDDVVIRNERVASYYRQLLNDLGVPISEEKSLVSIDTFEFAKRLFHKGQEVTGFPIAAFMSA